MKTVFVLMFEDANDPSCYPTPSEAYADEHAAEEEARARNARLRKGEWTVTEVELVGDAARDIACDYLDRVGYPDLSRFLRSRTEDN